MAAKKNRLLLVEANYRLLIKLCTCALLADVPRLRSKYRNETLLCLVTAGRRFGLDRFGLVLAGI